MGPTTAAFAVRQEPRCPTCRRPKIPVRLLLNEVGFPAELGSMPQPVEGALVRRTAAGRRRDRRLAIVGARAATTAGAGSPRELRGVGRAGGIRDRLGRRARDRRGRAPRRARRGRRDVRRARLRRRRRLSRSPRRAVRRDRRDAAACISEYPPGTPPRGGQFPARNRIIAALAEAVLVVEAGFASGRADHRARRDELGRRVLAVPGSPGTDELIATGAARRRSRTRTSCGRALAGEARRPRRCRRASRR